MRIGGMFAASLIVVCATGALASTRPPLTKSETGWRELQSDNFLVQTNLEGDQASAVVGLLEASRSRIAAVLAVPVKAPRLRVIVFGTQSEMQLYLSRGQRTIGTFAFDGTGRRHLLLAGDSGADLHRSIAHQLAFYLATWALQRGPRWLVDGLGNQVFLSHPIAGQPLSKPLAAQLATAPIPIKQVFDWSSKLDADYDLTIQRAVTSAFLVEMLKERHTAPFADLQKRLAQGEEPVRAWNAAFPEWNQADDAALSRLDAALLAHWSARKKSAPEEKPPPAGHVDERPMALAEVQTLQLEFQRSWPSDALRGLVSQALSRDPGHVAALTIEARADFRGGLPLARKAVAAHPDDPEAWRFLARNLTETGNAKEREAAERKAVALGPERVMLALDLAGELLHQDRIDESVAIVRAAVAQAPGDAAPLTLQAHVLAAAGQCGPALAAANQVLGIIGDRGNAEDQKAAREGFRGLEHRCSSPEANRADALVREAHLSFARGDQEQAVKLLEKAAATDPVDRNWWNELGLAYIHLDRSREAVAALEKQLKIVPDHAEAWSNLGLARVQLGQFTEAEAAFRKQLEVQDDQRYALLNLGTLLIRVGRADEARIPLDRLLTLEPRNTNAALALARAEIASGYKDRGVARLAQLVTEVPGPSSLNGAAYALTQANVELDMANEWARRAVDGGTDRLRSAANEEDAVAKTQSLAAAWDTLGWVRFQLGDLAGAERYIRAAERIRLSAELSDHLGQILEQAGHREEAARAYARALVSPEPEFEINARLAKVAGPGKAQQLIDEARTEMAGLRSFKVPPAGAQKSPNDLLLVFKADGELASVRAPGGAPLPPGADALRGQSLKLDLPLKGAVMVRARYTCTATACVADFGGSRPGTIPAPQKQ